MAYSMEGEKRIFPWILSSLFLCTVCCEQQVQQSVCPTLVPPYMGDTSGTCFGAVPGNICTVTCRRPFELRGPSSKVCNSSTEDWEPQEQQTCLNLQQRCRPLPPPTHGQFLEPCYNFVGSRCSIGCRPGYQLFGTQYRYCTQSKRWVPAQPLCRVVSCRSLSAPKNGRIVKTTCGSSLGSSCEFACEAGYHMSGSRLRRCMFSGKWTGEATRCEKFCPSLPRLRHGELRGECSPGIPGQKCQVMCLRGFKADKGRYFLTCRNDGTWNSLLPTCKRVECPPLLPPANGNYFGVCSPGQFARPCIFECNKGYELKGRSSLYCKPNGQWSGTTPSCRKGIRCPPLSLGKKYFLQGSCKPGLPGDWCRVKCLSGYMTERNVTCLKDGRWSSTPPSCNEGIPCAKPRRPRNGFLVNCTRNVGSICRQFCKPGFVPVGPSYKVCLPTGKWEGRKLKCRLKKRLQTWITSLSSSGRRKIPLLPTTADVGEVSGISGIDMDLSSAEGSLDDLGSSRLSKDDIGEYEIVDIL